MTSAAQKAPWIARVFRRGTEQAGVITFGKRADLVFATGVTLAIPFVATLAIPLAAPLAATADPERYWLLQTVHQLAALALTLLVMRLVSTRSWSDWGLNLRNAKQGILLAAGFAAIISVPVYLLMDAAPTPTTSITPVGIIAVLATHFLIIGATQEVLYRGFVMGFLENQGPAVYRAGGWEMPLTGLLATVIFVVSHVKPYPPFIWPEQLAFATAYGILYAIIYHRTRSLLGPALAHGYSNTAYVAMLLLKFS
jgi:membrane protease YdiL (CAAX protease family)